MTANNVTYAVMGEAMSYWDFFPAEDGWGRVPMWGFAEVERSEAEGVEPGTRLYGYLPPVLAPRRDAGRARTRRGFVDGSPHRAALPSAYHRYLASGADPFYRADTEDDPDAAAPALLHLLPDRRPARRRGADRAAGRS